MFRWLLILSATISGGTACADVFWPTPLLFQVPRAERRALESVACRPLGVALQASLAIDVGDDRSNYNATARCARHATLYGQPVVFERSCAYDNGWTCEAEIETVLAEFPDRRVLITAEAVPLTEAYWIVSHFVLGHLFAPADVMDLLGGATNPPLDNCRVKGMGGNELEIKCQLAHRWVERVRSEGTTRYRQVPLPWCATTDNDACVSEP